MKCKVCGKTLKYRDTKSLLQEAKKHYTENHPAELKAAKGETR